MGKEKTTIRLDKYLGDLGYGTRKELRTVIRKGFVTVNGATEKKPNTKVSVLTDEVALDGEVLTYRRFVYLIMNKPPGVISATADPYGEETPVTDLLPDDYFYLGLFPVGRLDKDAAGLLILTNDGPFAHRMTSPKKGQMKTYYCVVAGTYRAEHALAAAEGLEIDGGYRCRPAELYTLAGYIEQTGKHYLLGQCREFAPAEPFGPDTYEAILRIAEGKFHQVKRMFRALGQEVRYLKRVGFAGYDLPQGLAEGAVTPINPDTP